MNGVRKVRSLGLALILVLAMGILPLAAQDTGSGQGTGTRTSCDSTLILLAGLAQRYFGFTSLSGMDMSTFEYGQYSPFWDMAETTAQSSIGGSATGNTSGDAAGATGSADNSNVIGGVTGSAQATSEAGMGTDTGSGMTPSVYLNPPALADEDPMCLQLRAELEGFFATQLADPNWDTNFRSNWNSMNSGTGMDSTATPGG